MAVPGQGLSGDRPPIPLQPPRGTAAGLSGAGGRVPCPLRSARRAGGAAAGAAPSPRQRRSPRSEENSLGAWALRVRIRGAPTGRWPAGPWRSRTTSPSPGAPMRSGPVLLDRYVPDEDARVVERVLDAGATILGEAVCESCASPGSYSHTAGWSTSARLPQVRRGMRCTMQPRIDRTQFGSVTIDGTVYEHDVLIRLGGQVQKRKKKLSKAVYGTSHTISLAEAKHLPEGGRPAAHRRWPVRQGRAVRGGGCPPRAPPLPGGAAADAGGDPGLEPGRGRRHRHAPRDLLRQSPPRDQSAPGQVHRQGRALPHRGRGRGAKPAARRGPLR
jgi:hypothetical protein